MLFGVSGLLLLLLLIDIKNRHINYQLRCNRSALRNRTVCVGKRPPCQKVRNSMGRASKATRETNLPEGSVTHLNSQACAWENKGYHHFSLVEDGPVIIKCDKCGASLSCSNPSQSTSIHTTACTARKREYEDAVARRRSPRGKGARPGEDPGGSPSGSGQCALPKRQRTLDHTLVTAAQ